MKSLSLYLSGLVLVPACLSANSNPGGEQCFSQKLDPPYPCCNDNPVLYSDNEGDWGIKDGDWCGIGGVIVESCFSVTYGYPCCDGCKVLYTDNDGDWGVENGDWCGIKDSCGNNTESDISDLDLAFLKMENNKKNMLYSPLSIKYALKMLKEGATGNTYDEIDSVISDDVQLPKYSSIGENLSIANGLFIKDTYYDSVNAEFVNTLDAKYKAEIIEDEFRNASNVNKWIENKTLGIIKNMLDNDTVSNAVMIIANALALDMEWTYHFNSRNTRGKTFYTEEGSIVATMMYKEESSQNVAYYLDDDVTAIKINLQKYSGKQFEFMVIMPTSDLSGYIKNLSKDKIEHIDQNLILASDTKNGVEIGVPKFKFNYDLKLKEDLIKLGINDAFDMDKASFTKISEKEPVYVSKALHKADIEFSEDGIKAAAVTAFVMKTKAIMPGKNVRPLYIEIDKPFMFMIRDVETKDIWFAGTVYKPNLWENDRSEYGR